MSAVIKIDLKQKLFKDDQVIIELGCGSNKTKGHIGIDRLNFDNVDIVADLEEGLPFLPANSIDEIHAFHLFEHIDNFEFLISEIVRVLKEGGTCHAVVPHFSNPYYFSDYSHKTFFGLYTFYYFVDKKRQLKRKVPNYYTKSGIIILNEKLIFFSPFKGRGIIKKIIGKIVNSCSYIKEFYEENLCYVLPCYAIEIVFAPVKK